MSDSLAAYSIQNWLESCPQGYLEDTEYGHRHGEREPEELLRNGLMQEETVRTTVQLVLGERCALAASSGLINAAPDEASKRFLATQTLDEARHVEIFTQRLFDLGVKREELETTIAHYANPNLVKFAETLLDKVDKKDFIAGVVGQNIVLEGMAFSVFEMLLAMSEGVNPKFAHTLSGTIADERRHVGFGENRIGALIARHPEKKTDVERLQKEMSYYMLATFADAFRNNPAADELKRFQQQMSDAGHQARWQGVDLDGMQLEEMEAVLADTVLKDFKARLNRLGVEYQTPVRP